MKDNDRGIKTETPEQRKRLNAEIARMIKESGITEYEMRIVQNTIRKMNNTELMLVNSAVADAMLRNELADMERKVKGQGIRIADEQECGLPVAKEKQNDRVEELLDEAQSLADEIPSTDGHYAMCRIIEAIRLVWKEARE